MNAKYVETEDLEIIRKQLEHAERCGLTWEDGNKPTEWCPIYPMNIGYDIEDHGIDHGYDSTCGVAVSLSEWCAWLDEITTPATNADGWKILDLKNPPNLTLDYEKEAYNELSGRWEKCDRKFPEIFRLILECAHVEEYYRYRKLPKKSRIEKLAEKWAERLGVDAKLLKEAFEEASK